MVVKHREKTEGEPKLRKAIRLQISTIGRRYFGRWYMGRAERSGAVAMPERHVGSTKTGPLERDVGRWLRAKCLLLLVELFPTSLDGNTNSDLGCLLWRAVSILF